MNTFLINTRQSLIELMADFLDGHYDVNDPEPRDKSELHIRMAEAAFIEFQKTCISGFTTSQGLAPYTKEDIEKAIEFGFRQFQKWAYIDNAEQETFIQSLTPKQ